jgi:phage protein U
MHSKKFEGLYLSANDYYAQGERVTGQWLGKGAESLGLSGEVRPEALQP